MVTDCADPEPDACHCHVSAEACLLSPGAGRSRRARGGGGGWEKNLITTVSVTVCVGSRRTKKCNPTRPVNDIFTRHKTQPKFSSSFGYPFGRVSSVHSI